MAAGSSSGAEPGVGAEVEAPLEAEPELEPAAAVGFEAAPEAEPELETAAMAAADLEDEVELERRRCEREQQADGEDRGQNGTA